MATLEVINVGSSANDGTGDPLRVAFEKVNNNFANLWATGFNTTDAVTIGNSTQAIFTVPVAAFTQATLQVNTTDANSANSQNIVINAAISSDGNSVKFTGHSTTFFGDPLTNYDMDVVSGNVVLYSVPLVDSQLNHFIAYQITYYTLPEGSYIVINQDTTDYLGTEASQILITES